MSSQYCTHCMRKGDIKACKATECFAHESWYALEMIAENAKLVEALECMMIGAAAVAVPHPKEREVLQDAYDAANGLLQQLKENDS